MSEKPELGLLGAGLACTLLLVWIKIPPSVMAAAMVGKVVDPLWPNMVSCAVLVACMALLDV